MLLRLVVSIYFAFGAATVLGCLSVAQSPQYQDDYLIRRQDLDGSLTFGIKMFTEVNFQGTSTTITNASVDNPIPLGASFQILGNAWAALTSTSDSDNTSVIIWDSAPDTSVLPIPQGSLSFTDIQSTSCSPPCAGPGICDQFLSVCACPKGFNGTQCQSCAKGHFGPTCQPCPSNCASCDEGISGSGICLLPKSNTTTKCKCKNALCDDSGECTCLPGWGPSDNGTQCAQCRQTYFLGPVGGCESCQVGCAVCDDHSGNCITCKNGYTLDLTDKTKCRAKKAVIPGGEMCPPKSFYSGVNIDAPCANCSAVCQYCNGPTSNDCITQCSVKRSMFNNSCVTTDDKGICEGSGGMIADNVKHLCESCGAIVGNCVSCEIPNFDRNSTINDARCTKCLDGFFLSKGKCVKSCPSNSFISGNSTTCTECVSPCTSCAEAADICLSCSKGRFASSGKCVKTCPKGTFISNNTCINCHPDCKTCKGTSYTQCLSCPKKLPVLKSGRCLATCLQPEFFDKSNSTCTDCDSSCSSCSGSGPDKCLSCAISSYIVINGTCFPTPQLGPPSQLDPPSS